MPASMSAVLDQKNYIEELNRHLNATVTSLQAKVEGLATTNALMKEDLSISRTSAEKIQAENKRLRADLERLRMVERTVEKTAADISGQQGETKSAVASSYESGIKELSQEFRNRLQEEMTQREEAEKQLERQNNAKRLMEQNIAELTEDTAEKQALICSLKGQLEDIKCINLEMYTKLAECEFEISQKGELVAKLENKTKEISQMLNNLNTMTEKGEKS